MKLKLLSLGVCIFGLTLSACSPTKARQNVVDTHKTVEVVPVPGETHNFLARRPDGSVWFVDVDALSGGINSSTQLFGEYVAPELPTK